MSNLAAVKIESESFVKPKYEVEESKQPYYLGPWDLAMLSGNYIQKGLLFAKPLSTSMNQDNHSSMDEFLASLKDSLSLTLTHFYPAAGRLATQVDEDRHECLVFVDCSKGHGAKFIYGVLDMKVSDILSPRYVPEVVQSFFDHHKAVNYDGRSQPLLSVQVTELVDGVFIGVSMNHVLGDGAAYWHFWKRWSETHTKNGQKIIDSISQQPPIHKRWLPDGYNLPISLPFIHPDEFISRPERADLRERFFHFSSSSMASLKARANKESNTTKISSFQSLSALVWRSIVRANRIPCHQITNCRLAINNRPRLDPPLPETYFGNSLNAVRGTAIVRELLRENLGWAALILHQAVVNHRDNAVREFLKGWFESPIVYQFGQMFDPSSVMIGSSPRFDMYGNEFGLGKAIAVRSGYANKFTGKVSSFPGREGGGSVDLEICLPPESMSALESDPEFMAAVSCTAQRRETDRKLLFSYIHCVLILILTNWILSLEVQWYCTFILVF